MIPYIKPTFRAKNFNCPHCHVNAMQRWDGVYRSSSVLLSELYVAFCNNCRAYSLWMNGEMLFPNVSTAPPPNSDLDPDIQIDFLEAGSIVNKSPRGAAALLRLCIQKLCIQLGLTGKDLNKDIGALVADGLSPRIQKALDAVRVVGNESVHPGEMNIRDDIGTAYALFDLVNRIAVDRLTHPKELDELYNNLPETKLKGIESRDRK
jgi:Domain of unknown function (DUF4145)